MKTNVNLKTYNSFGFDAVAKEFVKINDANELQTLIRRGQLKNKDVLVLSGGNNILFTKEVFDGIVVYMNNKGIKRIVDEDDHAIFRVQAGEDWPEFVRQMVAKGLHGVENLANIPGKVGAAPVQNIGAYGMELKDSFLQCEAIELTTGEKRVFAKEECQFGYRASIFKNKLKGQYVITSVDFLLHKQAELKLEYGNIKAYLSENDIENPTLQQLHDAICAIRDAKLPDVKQIGSAGSFFKNPVISTEQFEALKQQYPNIPYYPDADGMVKVPAGWLIEHCGPSTLRRAQGSGTSDSEFESWKGWRDEQVGVYDKQALVLVHFGGGKGEDIVYLAKRIQDSVEEKFGISISPEVNFV